MKLEIPNPLIYIAVGIAIDMILRDLCNSDLKKFAGEVSEYLKEKQEFEERRKNKVVDLNGDTVGHMDEKGNIIGDDINE